MAICISGDFESEKMIELIDKYFGGFEPKEVQILRSLKKNRLKK